MIKSHGFTLIEVLIAMLVLALGLLGLAGLQATSLTNNVSAYNRSQATELAYDLADRIRANIAGLITYTSVLPANATAQSDCVAVSTTCTAADMAQNDLYEWNRNVTTTLPGGAGTIGVNSGVYTITINWDDNRDGNVNTSDPNFQTTFRL
ncbi:MULTISPECIES: type IV pilus modification protein PilV [Methylomonas]|uniref:Type IV pilus modification protein PilV n=2 Tax=Methylomonas TaxID=416 RepID=A0A126T866_9GAMM|nr:MULTISPECIES: type IV pilus modification protein PilV [Methylomonas]AMK78283.1 type IV pilus modification protein PilV [Methylomonas denitrificans]OAI04000.1 type IV pilus modification protein PilV [Methylomonas methanica]TCV87686.1 type IV pilus assembly protein PilV [Methylomonas methanica]